MDKEKIRQALRALRGNTPREKVAYDLGISSSAWAMYESGARIPRDEMKIKIADYFGTTVSDIFYSKR